MTSKALNSLDIMQSVVEVAARASQQVMSLYRIGFIESARKGDNSPVTPADEAAQAVMLRDLPRIAAIPIVSEESGASLAEKAAILAEAPFCWLVDPLDGTRDFLARTGDFVINIALMARGVPVVGVVHVPIRRVTYMAARGVGSFRKGPFGARTRLKTRPLRSDGFVGLVSRQHQSGELEKLRRLWPQGTYLSVGSAFKYALIAEGAADLAVRFTPTSPWDTAAPQVILELAGGSMIGFDGQPLSYAQYRPENAPFVALGDRSFDARALLRRLE